MKRFPSLALLKHRAIRIRGREPGLVKGRGLTERDWSHLESPIRAVKVSRSYVATKTVYIAMTSTPMPKTKPTDLKPTSLGAHCRRRRPGTQGSCLRGALNALNSAVNCLMSSTVQSSIREKKDVPRRSRASTTRSTPAAVREIFTARRSAGSGALWTSPRAFMRPIRLLVELRSIATSSARVLGFAGPYA